jgi:hypothetical protein
VKRTARTIDRATLLKSGGTAALTTLLIGALEGRADACCSPIDLTYQNSDLAKMSDVDVSAIKTSPYAASLAIRGIRLYAQPAGQTMPPRLEGWTPRFFIKSAAAAGVDEAGRGHGLRSKAKPPQPLTYGIWIYTK